MPTYNVVVVLAVVAIAGSIIMVVRALVFVASASALTEDITADTVVQIIPTDTIIVLLP